ncbi:DUF2309 domain-containing protein [Halobaculum sp. MBLA0147]|uniref:DUF2309 domain-containing protein n=1 Tax=Halobaculum sp. MBLA0147 TaxID=3079934 RepID=UPI00352463AD
MSTDRRVHDSVDVQDSIEAAADAVGSVWPLHSFVTANPLAGFEDRPFHEAVADAERLLGGDGYPSVDVFRRAWESGRIDTDVLETELAAAGYDLDPETALDRMASDESDDTERKTERSGADSETAEADVTNREPERSDADDRVDTVLTKWLSSFLDQDQAEWPMPNREQGFYHAFRSVARHDRAIPNRERLAELPDSPVAAIRTLLDDYPTEEWEAIFASQFAALPGWTGLLKRRAADDGAWQSTYPITLAGYLAVRLTLANLFDAPLAPDEGAETAVEGEAADGGEEADDTEPGAVPLPEVWLSAWEATYREELVGELTDASEALVESDSSGSGVASGGAEAGSADTDRPDAQLVFCIDTRSEIIRRHVERVGDYETHGYAGFFGVPMRYSGYDSDVTVDACPPIVDAGHRIDDRPREGTDDERDAYDRWHGVRGTAETVIESLETNAATAFSFVESAGVGYGAALAARTLLPSRVYDLLDGVDERIPDDHEFCEPGLDPDDSGDGCDGGAGEDHDGAAGDLPRGLSVDEKVEYAAAAFELTGWEEFARVVVFAGHASQTTNNPFDASLDCGACAGNPGGPSARVLAAICNEEAVRARLRERGIEIPEDTVFVAGEHDTTTDEIELFADDVPETHERDVERLRRDLADARAGAAAERAEDMGVTVGDAEAGLRETQRRAADWAETRPEWGLAGNAGFVVGPRALTADLDLDGRSFLHSYDWRTDPDGDALEAILTGPMVVTQWINTQYYFATVDNAVYGSGSKVTQNPVGNVGVYQGNGGDLMTGLPLQSLTSGVDEPYHQPIRLSTVIHAPVDRVTETLSANEAVAELLDNDWHSLTVVDPERDHRAFHYEGGLEWEPLRESEPSEAVTPTPLSVGDD